MVVAGTLPRDGVQRSIVGSWDLDKYTDVAGQKINLGQGIKKVPHYCRVWADDRYMDFPINPDAVSTLNSLHIEVYLTVLPRL
jgi:hypothetical protein